jgi:drug/metabolite transporter (DMT)-like permease
MTAPLLVYPRRFMHGSHFLSLSLALVAVSVSAILIKLCVSEPTLIAWYRLIAAGAVLLAWELAKRGRIEVDRHDVGVAAVSAFFLAGHFYFWIESLFMTTINSSVMLLAAQPLFALMLQPLMTRVPVRARNVISLLIGLAGVAVITRADLHQSQLAGKGDLYAIISAAMAALYLISGSRRRSRLIPYLGVMYTLSGLMLVAFALVTGKAMLPARNIDWLWLLLLVIVPTLIGHTLLNRAMHHYPSYVVNLSILSEPLLTSLFAYVVFGATPSASFWIGGLLVMGALIVEFLPGGAPPGVDASIVEP